jgi:hypothetical protein
MTYLTFRAMGAYSSKRYHDKVRTRSNGWGQSAVPFLVSILPGGILNLLGFAYFFCFHRRARMPLVDLMNSRFCFFKRT